MNIISIVQEVEKEKQKSFKDSIYSIKITTFATKYELFEDKDNNIIHHICRYFYSFG